MDLYFYFCGFFFYSGVGNGSWGVYCYLYCEVVLGGGVLCEGYSLVFGGWGVD